MAKSAELSKGVKHIEFSQGLFIKSYKDKRIRPNTAGVCAGLCLDWFRFYNKRRSASIYKGQDMAQVSFLYKEALRKYTNNPELLERIADSDIASTQKEEDSFVRRVQFYQALSQRQSTIKRGKISEFNIAE